MIRKKFFGHTSPIKTRKFVFFRQKNDHVRHTFPAPIRPEDNPAVARIIRTVMTEYGAVGPGYSIEDPEVDAMFETYDHPRALFLVLENNKGEPVGCGGIAPLALVGKANH